MQIKKKEVRNLILEKAIKEFLKNGYENASLRKIVKNAGTTIGNFYNYFDNKESLFSELVREEYKKFMHFLENHEEIENPDDLFKLTDISKQRSILTKMIQDIMPVLSASFVLLVECSKGTKYEGTREKVIDMAREHFIDHMNRISINSFSSEFADLLAEQMLNGLLIIIRKHSNLKLRKELMTDYLLFYFVGTMGILKD